MYTRETIKLHSSEIETQPQILTPNAGILVVLLVSAVLWLILGGVTLDTTLSIVIKIPAWLMYAGGVGAVIAAVFGCRYLRDEL